MKAPPSPQKYGLAIAISGAGLLVFWLSGELVPLLAATSLAFFFWGKGPGFLSVGVSGIGAGFVVFAGDAAATAEHGAYISLALFVATAVMIGILIQGWQRQRPLDRPASEAHAILDNIPGIIATADSRGDHNYANRKNRDYFGMGSSGFAGRGWLNIIHPEERDGIAAAWTRCVRMSEPMDVAHRLRRFDGEYRWFHARVEPAFDESGKIVRWYGLITDIDDRKRAEEALEARERQLQLLIDAVPTLVWSARADGVAEFLNRKWLEYTGLTQEQAIGWGWTAAVHPDDRDPLVEYWRSILAAGTPGEFEARLRRFDGHYRWFLFRGDPVRDASGAVVRWYGSNTEIDDHKRAEETLRERERELQLLVDAIPTLVWCVTPDGDPAYINKRLETYYGRTIDRSEPDEGTRLDRSLRRLMHPDDLQAVRKNLMHSLKTGEPFAMRYRNRRSDGVYRWVDARAEPLRGENGQIVKWYGVSIDIDDEVRAQDALHLAQEKLSRASQLAGLAELSAAIAHEVNQPLAAVITNSHACQRWLSADPPNMQRARITSERIVRDAMAAAEVIGRIRALFTRTASTKAAINLNEVIGEVRQLMIDEITSEGILIETDLDATLPPALADRVQMQQVLVNLIRNGIDATKSNADASRSLAIRSRRDGENMILVEVRDNGSGIAESGRIFEPFFTTKDGGMGMGLTICRSILESHDGRLWTESVHPKGTVFSFTLPIQSRDVA